MKPSESADLTKQLGKLFPNQLTKELAGFVARDLMGFSVSAAREAIAEHRRTHEFISIPQLIEGCRAAERGAGPTATDQSKNEGTWFDVRRRQGRHLAGASDAEVALRVKRGEWVRAQQHYPTNVDSWREKLTHECVALLALTGMDADSAGRWAATIFEDVEYFRQVLAELRGSIAAANVFGEPVGSR